MALYVKKFGGSSVATLEKMRHIVSRVLNDKRTRFYFTYGYDI